jgi:hypothetical protein
MPPLQPTRHSTQVHATNEAELGITPTVLAKDVVAAIPQLDGCLALGAFLVVFPALQVGEWIRYILHLVIGVADVGLADITSAADQARETGARFAGDDGLGAGGWYASGEEDAAFVGGDGVVDGGVYALLVQCFPAVISDEVGAVDAFFRGCVVLAELEEPFGGEGVWEVREEGGCGWVEDGWAPFHWVILQVYVSMHVMSGKTARLRVRASTPLGIVVVVIL